MRRCKCRGKQESNRKNRRDGDANGDVDGKGGMKKKEVEDPGLGVKLGATREV